MPYFNTLQYDVVIERIEREQPDKEGHRLKSLVETFFLQKSCRFGTKIMSVVGKIMSACGKNHVGLWKKSCWFAGKIISVCGKNLLVRKLHWKIPAQAPKNIPDYLPLFAQVHVLQQWKIRRNLKTVQTRQLTTDNYIWACLSAVNGSAETPQTYVRRLSLQNRNGLTIQFICEQKVQVGL